MNTAESKQKHHSLRAIKHVCDQRLACPMAKTCPHTSPHSFFRNRFDHLGSCKRGSCPVKPKAKCIPVKKEAK